mmetsp:Transcript_3020/g.3763  ORF Transcript_3020/g.3763 Transcript_3020/m.3763 type:complete len:82 (+) Transcript_3020:194-439(+)
MTLKKYCEGWGRLRVNKPLPRRATRKNHEPWQVKIIEDFLINVKRHPDAEEKKNAAEENWTHTSPGEILLYKLQKAEVAWK